MNEYNDYNSNNQQSNSNSLSMEQLLSTSAPSQQVPQQLPVQEQKIQQAPVPIFKRRKNRLVILLVVSLVFCGIIGLLLFLTQEKKEEKKEEQKESIWSGVYKNGGDYVKVYQISEDKLYFDIITERSRAYTTATIKGNKAEAKIYATYTLELNDNKLKVSSTDEYMLNATYTRKGNYTIEDIYKDNFGDPDYLNTDINGIFYYERINSTISIYQISENKAHFKITDGTNIYENDVTVVDGKIDHLEELANDSTTIKIEFNEEGLNIKIRTTNRGNFISRLSGDYIKTDSITMDDLLSERLK